MVPLGAALFFFLESTLSLTALAPKALAFSAGTFLYIAVADLLPHLQKGGKDGRLKRIVALGLGMAVMFALARFLRE